MLVCYPPGKIRWEGDRPVALLDLPLGMPTSSARSRRGTWALYPLGPEVLVVHPDGAVSGPPAEVAAEVGRLAAKAEQGVLDRQAAQTIQQLLTGDGTDPTGPRRRGSRTWSIPAKAYWLSGPDNHHVGPESVLAPVPAQLLGTEAASSRPDLRRAARNLTSAQASPRPRSLAWPRQDPAAV